MNFAEQLAGHIARVEQGLEHQLPAPTERPARLHSAMRYAVEAGGKRLRPVLVLATAELFGADPKEALPAAVAIECVHTYSLIHDDLPCMDNDDLRRGRPTTHKQFDEATALLAGDALLTHAFLLLTENYDGGLACRLVRALSTAAASRRLIGGQMEDLLAEKNQAATAEDLEFIHLNKTAAMIEASFVMGGLVGNVNDAQLVSLRQVAHPLGLAFQIIDDILDTTADTATLGKTAGKDARADKTTYVKLHGIDQARRLAAEYTERAITALRELPGETTFLRDLIHSMARRVK